jgi:hypothetical protein
VTALPNVALLAGAEIEGVDPVMAKPAATMPARMSERILLLHWVEHIQS